MLSVVYVVCRSCTIIVFQLCLLFGWVAGQCHQLALGDVILAQLAWPLNDVMFCLHCYTE